MALHEAADFTIRPRLLTIPGDLLCAARAAPFRADTPAMHTPDSPGRGAWKSRAGVSRGRDRDVER